MTIERKAYICEYCNDYRPIKKHAYLSSYAAWVHEESCYYNPKNRTCFTCKHNSGSSKRENNCTIGKNKFQNECIKNGLDFNRFFVSKQIETQCEYWEERVYPEFEIYD